MKATITLKFKPLFIALGKIGVVSAPVQTDLQARWLYSEWVYR